MDSDSGSVDSDLDSDLNHEDSDLDLDLYPKDLDLDSNPSHPGLVTSQTSTKV